MPVIADNPYAPPKAETVHSSRPTVGENNGEIRAGLRKRFNFWIVTFLLCAVAHWVVSGLIKPFHQIFMAVEVELPGMVVLYFNLQELLGGFLGIAAVLVIAYLSAIPVLRKWRTPNLGKWYVAGAVAMILSFAVPGSCFMAIHKIHLALEATEPPPASSIR